MRRKTKYVMEFPSPVRERLEALAAQSGRTIPEIVVALTEAVVTIAGPAAVPSVAAVPSDAPPRKRGRPRKQPSETVNAVPSETKRRGRPRRNPASDEAVAAPGAEKPASGKKRGRPKKVAEESYVIPAPLEPEVDVYPAVEHSMESIEPVALGEARVLGTSGPSGTPKRARAAGKPARKGTGRKKREAAVAAIAKATAPKARKRRKAAAEPSPENADPAAGT